MIKFLGLTCLCILICFNTAHSQKLSNTLLWRISGNGLKKPSYLYGTMHLTDERLFNLGDSLYNAIENTEGFAIEVNPEEMTAYLVNEINLELKNAVRIKEILNEKEFREYGPALSKKLKKPADKITTKDIFLEKNKWVEESYRKGKMSTFLDAYLYDIARRQGKWTGGVEDIDDQKGLIDDLVDESDIRQLAKEHEVNTNREADSFINLYLNGNLNAIDSTTNYADSAYVDNLLIKRNFKMARRIDSLDKIRSMVFAVGAAHLPGKDGLISLLQKKGFDIQPVFSSKKIKPENYKVKEIAIPWITIHDEDSLYKVDMPGQPGDIEMYGLVKMKMNFDLFNSTGYMVTAMATPYDKNGIDSLMNFYAVSLFKEKNPQNAKPVTINGISGLELESTDEGGYKHGYILYRNHIIYIALGTAVKKNINSENALNKFLSSYQAFERKEINKTDRYIYIDSIHSFKIDLPSKPQSADELIGAVKEKSVNSHLMISFDKHTGSYFFFGVSETAPGYFIENDSATLRNVENNTKAKYTAVKLDTIYANGNNRVLKMEGIMAKVNVSSKAYYELTGNRWYALLAMYDSSQASEDVDQFFRSFKILSSPAVDWKRQSPEDTSITTWMPAIIKYYSNDSNQLLYSKKYEAYDSTRGNSYDIIVSGLGKYYWQNSDSALWNAIQKNNTNYNDTVFFRRPVMNGNIKGIELQLREHGSFNIKRKRILLYGDTLYTLVTVQPQQDINDSNINKFFDDFRFNQPPPPITIFTSKAVQLINDLSNKDSALATQAQEALRDANFGAGDLTLLYSALLKEYERKNDNFKTVNEELARAIINIKDSTALKIAKEKYLLVTDKKIKNLLLDIISEYKTKENYVDLKNLLIASHPDTTLSYSFISNVKDSLALAPDLIRDVLPLLRDTNMAPAIINISSTLIDSNIIPLKTLYPYLPDILEFANYRYKKNKKSDEDYDYTDRFTISLLGKLNNTQSNAMLQKWVTLNNVYIKHMCVEQLLTDGQDVPPSALLKLAEDKSFRVDLYSSLKKKKKQNIFPKQYLSQQYFAESKVYEVASDDDEPSALTYLTQKVFMVHGKKGRFFFYKVTYSNDDTTYNLACAGPFNLNSLDLSADEANGSLYFEEDFDKSNLKQQMNALIRQIENEN